MVTLHEPDFPSLKVTVLQTADGGNTHIMARGVGFEPTMTISKTVALGLTRRSPNITLFINVLVNTLMNSVLLRYARAIP